MPLFLSPDRAVHDDGGCRRGAGSGRHARVRGQGKRKAPYEEAQAGRRRAAGAGDQGGPAKRAGGRGAGARRDGRAGVRAQPRSRAADRLDLEAGGDAGRRGQGAGAGRAVDDQQDRRRGGQGRREVPAAGGDDAVEPRSAARGADGFGQPCGARARARGEADARAAGGGDEREGEAAGAEEHALPGADGALGEQRVDAARGDRDAEAGDRAPGAGADHPAAANTTRIRSASRPSST